MKPGDVIFSQNDPNAPKKEEVPAPPAPPVNGSVSPQLPAASTSQPPEERLANDAYSNTGSDWKYRDDESAPTNELEPVEWTASEFIDHEKQSGWYAAVIGIALLIAIITYLLTRDLVNAVVIIMVAILFAVFGARKPRTLKYGLDGYGIYIGVKAYHYNEFRSFSVMVEGAISSIQLFPFKRFSTPISLYFPPEQEASIINTIGIYLPHEIRKNDPIERLMRKVRF